MSGSQPSDLRFVPLVCRSCHDEHAPAIQMVAETSRHATKRPVTPEIVHTCPACGALLVLSLQPAPQETSTS
jgi:hypothetical protein